MNVSKLSKAVEVLIGIPIMLCVLWFIVSSPVLLQDDVLEDVFQADSMFGMLYVSQVHVWRNVTSIVFDNEPTLQLIQKSMIMTFGFFHFLAAVNYIRLVMLLILGRVSIDELYADLRSAGSLDTQENKK